MLPLTNSNRSPRETPGFCLAILQTSLENTTHSHQGYVKLKYGII